MAATASQFEGLEQEQKDFAKISTISANISPRRKEIPSRFVKRYSTIPRSVHRLAQAENSTNRFVPKHDDIIVTGYPLIELASPRSKSQDIKRLTPFWKNATPSERARKFCDWVSRLPQTGVSLPNKAFDREEIYGE